VKNKLLYALAAPVLALLVAVVVSSIALLAIGESPATAFRAMLSSIDSSDAIVNILNRAGPYYVMGLAVALGFKMGLFNIGADGQYRIGALLAPPRAPRSACRRRSRAVHRPRRHGRCGAPTRVSPAC
jgi:simple sugar transport system permease protein